MIGTKKRKEKRNNRERKDAEFPNPYSRRESQTLGREETLSFLRNFSNLLSSGCFLRETLLPNRRLAARIRNYSRTDYGNGRGETFFQYHRSFHESRGTRMSVRNGEKSGHSLGIHFPESTIQLCCKKQRKRGKDRLYFLYSRVQNTRSLLSTSCRREKKK